MLNIAIINGPNLNLTGTREPKIYGNVTFDELLNDLGSTYSQINFTYYQSNVEGELINQIHECSGKAKGIIINAGAYSHTSIAIADALGAVNIPAIEVHISNVLAREEYRKTSYVAAKCIGSICGLGIMGYELAVQYFLSYFKGE